MTTNGMTDVASKQRRWSLVDGVGGWQFGGLLGIFIGTAATTMFIVLDAAQPGTSEPVESAPVLLVDMATDQPPPNCIGGIAVGDNSPDAQQSCQQMQQASSFAPVDPGGPVWLAPPEPSAPPVGVWPLPVEPGPVIPIDPAHGGSGDVVVGTPHGDGGAVFVGPLDGGGAVAGGPSDSGGAVVVGTTDGGGGFADGVSDGGGGFVGGGW